MDNKDFEELENDDLEEIDIEELHSKEVIENSNDFYNQNLNNQIRNIRKQDKGNQNAINRLRQRNANTMSKGVEAPESTPSTSNENDISPTNKLGEKLNPLNKNNGLSKIGKNTAKNVGQAAKEVGKQATKIAAKTASKALMFLITNPYFFVIVGVFLLVMIIPILWGAYDSDDSSSSSQITYVSGYEDCKSITVEGSGTYDLEVYVAGVIEHESYKDENIEALKAQAVAARTYAIYSTNHCTTSIGNSQLSQTFSATPSDISKKAANETSGQVLTYEGNVFSAMYDSFCYADSDCADSTYDSENKKYTVTYKKLPNNETHTVTLSQQKQFGRIVRGGGHAYGMSQLVSYQMASEGKKYDEILKYFYSDGIEISTITKTSGGLGIIGEFVIRTQKPDITISPDNLYFNATNAGTNWYQCPWYAKGRAIEILSTVSGISDEKRNTALEAVKASYGNGSDWYSLSQNGGTLSMFASSDDYTKPKPGAIISWKWTDQHWHNSKYKNQPNYGHVGIIENVDGNNVTVSDGWQICGGYNSSIECMGFRSETYDISYLQSFGGNYIFLGYVYLLD